MFESWMEKEEIRAISWKHFSSHQALRWMCRMAAWPPATGADPPQNWSDRTCLWYFRPSNVSGIPIKEITVGSIYSIIEYSELEGTHKNHPASIPGPAQMVPRFPPCTWECCQMFLELPDLALWPLPCVQFQCPTPPGEESLPNIQPEPHSYHSFGFCLSGHHRKEISFFPSSSPCEESGDCCQVSPQSSIFQAELTS